MKYDPELEERVFELIFPYSGPSAGKLARRIVCIAHEFYLCNEFGVEIEDEPAD